MKDITFSLPGSPANDEKKKKKMIPLSYDRKMNIRKNASIPYYCEKAS